MDLCARNTDYSGSGTFEEQTDSSDDLVVTFRHTEEPNRGRFGSGMWDRSSICRHRIFQ